MIYGINDNYFAAVAGRQALNTGMFLFGKTNNGEKDVLLCWLATRCEKRASVFSFHRSFAIALKHEIITEYSTFSYR
jgi:hypothetical protein